MSIDSNIDDLYKKIEKDYKINSIIKVDIIRKSIDSRDKNNILFIYTVNVEINNEKLYLSKNKFKNVSKAIINKYEVKKVNKNLNSRPVIVGCGPAGLFSALILVQSGIKPIVIERGKKVEERLKDIENFSNNRILNIDSNIQFGEGGAGTFSDGKLTTGTNDERITKVIDEFISFGAPREIMYDYKPHIGTDILVETIKNIRNYLIDNGAELRFNTKLTNIIIDNNKIIGIEVNNNEEIATDEVVLAIGHSARDTFEMLHSKGIKLEQKNFSIGVRIEHLQESINKSQYGKYYNHKALDPIDYKLVYHSNKGRSAYTFCVCPGGFVVPASSEKGMVVTNGMSKYKRDNININGALLVNVEKKDYESDHPLAGMYLQRKLEKRAYELGGSNYNAPAQRVEDFLNNKKSTSIGKIKPSYSPGVTLTDLNLLLPNYISDTLKEAIKYFDTKIKGFADGDAILTAIESRSSSPIKIVRTESFESVGLSGLYPIGEGAGYAGGIVTSAVDGIKASEKIIEKYL